MGKLYVFGGFVQRRRRAESDPDRVEVYNPTSNSWARLKDLPFPHVIRRGSCALSA